MDSLSLNLLPVGRGTPCYATANPLFRWATRLSKVWVEFDWRLYFKISCEPLFKDFNILQLGPLYLILQFGRNIEFQSAKQGYHANIVILFSLAENIPRIQKIVYVSMRFITLQTFLCFTYKWAVNTFVASPICDIFWIFNIYSQFFKYYTRV